MPRSAPAAACSSLRTASSRPTTAQRSSTSGVACGQTAAACRAASASCPSSSLACATRAFASWKVVCAGGAKEDNVEAKLPLDVGPEPRDELLVVDAAPFGEASCSHEAGVNGVMARLAAVLVAPEEPADLGVQSTRPFSLWSAATGTMPVRGVILVARGWLHGVLAEVDT